MSAFLRLRCLSRIVDAVLTKLLSEDIPIIFAI